MADLADPRRIPTAALALGLAGLIPFAAAALAEQLPQVPVSGLKLGIVYGAVILSFLGGIRWGIAIGPYGRARQASDMVLSVLPALAGWLAAFLPAVAGVCLLLSGIIMQALWDVLAVEDGRLPEWFGRLRMILTMGAVLALTALLVQQLA